jgi:hypothetical protein
MFKRSFDSLSEIIDFTDGFFSDEPADPATRYAVDLAIDELFSNMVKYNSHSPAEIGVTFARAGNVVSVTLTDYESEPFDITRARPVDINVPAQKRAIGGLDYISSAGLGVLLVAQKRAMSNGAGLTIININKHINDVFRFSGFDKIFKLERKQD